MGCSARALGVGVGRPGEVVEAPASSRRAPVVVRTADGLRTRLLEGLRPSLRDPVLAVGLGVLAVGLHLGFDQRAEGALVRVPDWAAVLVLAAMAVSLRWRRSHPENVMAFSGGLTAVYYLTGHGSPAAVVLLTFALYGITAFGEERIEGVLSLGACWFFMTVSFVVGGDWGSVASPGYVLSGFIFTVAWALGESTRSRTALTDELRRRNAQLAALRDLERDELVAEERRRIARELHDVVSHTVSVVVVQAAAARRVVDVDPEAAGTALEAIERAAREAMGQLRSMLGVLREDDRGAPDHPTPDRHAFEAMLEELRATGMPLRVEGGLPDDVGPGVALTVHRVVQEALTNVLRHAEDVTEVVVRVEHGADGLVVEVVDDGRPAGFTHGAGAGLVGIRERTGLHGGTVEAGSLGPRGFRVHVTIPTGVAA